MGKVRNQPKTSGKLKFPFVDIDKGRTIRAKRITSPHRFPMHLTKTRIILHPAGVVIAVRV